MILAPVIDFASDEHFMGEALRQAGNSQVTYSELPDHAHNVWEPCFAEDKAMQWLFSQSKNQPSG